jgi:hypothetical protein
MLFESRSSAFSRLALSLIFLSLNIAFFPFLLRSGGYFQPVYEQICFELS